MLARDEDFEIFRDMTIKVLESEIVPHYEAWDEAEKMPREVWNTLGEAGLLGVDLPEEYGGAAASFDINQMVQSEMGRLCLGGLATNYSVHSNIVLPYILNLGTDEQKQRWIPPMITGECIGAIAMSEPGAGSDLQGMKTTAVEDGDHWVINGSKTFITNGIYAGLVIVCAKTDTSAGARGISLFLVDTTTEGFATGKKLEKIGQHTSDTAELFFTDMRIPKDSVLGQLNGGFVHLMTELPRERLGLAAGAIGSCDGALEITCEYVKDRKAFGTSIASFQNTRFKLAELKAKVEVVRAYFEKCMGKFMEGTMTTEDASILKLQATETQLEVVDGCLQLFGGYGYTREYPISRFYRDARVQTIYGGTSEIMKEVIARPMLGR